MGGRICSNDVNCPTPDEDKASSICDEEGECKTCDTQEAHGGVCRAETGTCECREVRSGDACDGARGGAFLVLILVPLVVGVLVCVCLCCMIWKCCIKSKGGD